LVVSNGNNKEISTLCSEAKQTEMARMNSVEIAGNKHNALAGTCLFSNFFNFVHIPKQDKVNASKSLAVTISIAQPSPRIKAI
jgi:hypothetical protein